MAVFSVKKQRRQGILSDALLLCFVFIVLYALFRLGAGMTIPFSSEQQPVIDLSPAMLPYYAGRSLLRMLLAFILSLLFTLVYGYTAAKIRIAGRVLVPLPSSHSLQRRHRVAGGGCGRSRRS